MFKFNTAIETLLECGPGQFEITKVFQTGRDGSYLMTRAGHPYLKIEMAVTDCLGTKGILYENLISNIGWKIKQFANSIGMPHLFNQGEFDPRSLVGRRGLCDIGLKPAENNYPEKSIVKKFVEGSVDSTTAYMPPVSAPSTIEEAFDDIPF